MFANYRRALLCHNLNLNLIKRTLPILRPSSVLLQPSPSSFSLSYPYTTPTSTSTSKQHSFTLNYLINNCGFSPETASILSNRVRLENSERPDLVLTLFRSHGFSNAQICGLIETCPKLLAFNPNKTILPKIEFLLSKGASSSDLVQIVTKNPRFLYHSLENSLTPCYDLVRRFLLSDESTMSSVKACVGIISSKNPTHNIQVLLDHGVPDSKVAILLRYWTCSLLVDRAVFEKAVEEVKELGFSPKTTVFTVALRAKILPKSLWERKIDLYKKWGWSEEIIVSTFVRYPWCMLASEDKIEAVMEFWVNRMGWESLVLAKYPILLMLSLEKRVIPRAFVLQFLQSRGLLKDAKSGTPFKVSEKMFLQKFVNCFEEEASQLLKLYEEKRDLSR